MCYSIYDSLNIGPLKGISVIIQLVDKSYAYPKGALEDVLVQVNKMLFSTYFYVIDMWDMANNISTTHLLGKPFRKIACTKIDGYNETLTWSLMESLYASTYLKQWGIPMILNLIILLILYTLLWNRYLS